MNFAKFGNAVAKQWRHMESYPLFRVDLGGREVWDAYLISFPVGSNPIFRVREHHNCNCCRQFIRTIGNVVAVIDNKVVSIWDVTVPDEPEYQAVADALSEYVKSKQIVAPFFHYEKQVGTAHSSAMFDSKVTKFDHFALQINERSVIAPKDSIALRVSDVVQARDVFVRALDEITLSAIDTVLDLVHSKALYRGEEHQHAVNEFRKLRIEYDAFVGNDKSAFVWRKAVLSPPSVARIRNT